MKDPVMILNTDRKIKAINLCDWLVDIEVAHLFEVVGSQYCVTVAEADVKVAMMRLSKD